MQGRVHINLSWDFGERDLMAICPRLVYETGTRSFVVYA
jgi:hypothetical protein